MYGKRDNRECRPHSKVYRERNEGKKGSESHGDTSSRARA